MKYQNLFSEKNIINLSCAKSAQSVVKDKTIDTTKTNLKYKIKYNV